MWVWNANTLATWCKELIHLKRPQYWERLKAGGEGDDRGWDGWMASLTQWTWVWLNSRSWWWTGRLVCCGSWGCKELDMTERLNWTGLTWVLASWEQGMWTQACAHVHVHTHIYTCTHQRISPFNLRLLNLPLTFDTAKATEHEHMQEMHDRLITES